MDTSVINLPIEPALPEGAVDPFTRRRFLRVAAVAGGGVVAATIAACAPATAPTWTFGPVSSPGSVAGPVPSPSANGSRATALPSMAHSVASAGPSGSPAPSGSAVAVPPGWSDHDVAAKLGVDRFLAAEYDHLDQPSPNQPLKPELDGGVKVFRLTIGAIKHRIDAVNQPLDALGFNGAWTGPLLRVVEGDRVRAIFKNDLNETTGIHFHGQDLPNAVDGVPMITQPPIVPGAEFAYEFVAGPAGSHMYHSHHNATDQVGRGLLGAFIVDPKDPKDRPDALYGVSQDIVWISNDQLGGFTINGRGFPATYPIVAKLGDKILVRFMNEGVMTHPWHLHGQPMRVVARDGYPLGAAAFTCDTLGVNPGERWDVVIECRNPGVWAFHCHILPHAEAMAGMFGMVTALIVQDGAAAIQVLPPLADLALGQTSTVPYVCAIPNRT